MSFILKSKINTKRKGSRCEVIVSSVYTWSLERLCAERSYEILERAAVDRHHRTTLLARMAPNFFGESALFRFRKQGGD